ncbi:hypothetical protein N7494_000592 [Penicillium frequentans]|uniref:Xylanolytic transcriptional activator regulatory domain-containing protein n=1 Tax=Penicillium frequentans TaxID=3151616 RepID=A0AAD6D8I4_9EURO|nr:hypothetical protein N7494_000592 [Penicillium glabrum]
MPKNGKWTPELYSPTEMYSGVWDVRGSKNGPKCARVPISSKISDPTSFDTLQNGPHMLCVYHDGPRRQRPSAARIDFLEGERSALEDMLTHLKDADDAQRKDLLESMAVLDGRVLVFRPNMIPTDGERHMMEILSPQKRGGNAAHHKNSPSRHDDHDPRLEDGDPGAQYLLTIRKKPARRAMVQSSMSSERFHHEQPHASTDSLQNQLFANAAVERQREHLLRGLSTIRGVPQELALHLLDLHWSRQHHTFLLTYRPTFMRELEHGGPYCSDLLLYAVFACASKFSERPDLGVGQRFFARCDELLLHEGLIIQSSIPTVIALVMLGSTFIASGMTSKGWLYTGYAIRMIYDLGLYLEPPTKANKFNIEEIEIRRRVFWGAFVCEKLQSLYLGRPPAIRLQDVRVSHELLDTFEELEPWHPHHDCDPPEAHSTSSPLPLAHSVTVFQQLCLLSQVMTQIIDRIYGAGATASTTFHEVRPLEDALTAWYSNLPVHLIYEPWTRAPLGPPPMVAPNHIILLTTYHSLIVLLHRPFITIPSNNNNIATAPIGTPASSWKQCTAASEHITSLALNYQSIYPLRKSSYLLGYAVYVACTIHVHNTASLAAGPDKNAFTESASLLAASLKCLDALAVPNSGAADTARRVRRLMVAQGVEESPATLESQVMAQQQFPENPLQFSDISPTYDDFEQMQSSQGVFEPGPDLLFGFMDDNTDPAAFDLHEPISW